VGQQRRIDTLARHSQTFALDQQNDFAIIIPLARLAFIDTRLPNVSAAKRDQLVNFAIEDKLTIDPATVHAVVLGPSLTSEQHFIVAAMSSSWLTSVIEWLSVGDIKPRLAYPASAMYAVKAGEWVVALGTTGTTDDTDAANQGMAIRQDGLAYQLEASDFTEPPFQLTLALNEAVAASSGRASPRTIRVSKTDKVQFDAARWQGELGSGIALVLDDVAVTSAVIKSAHNLLVGKFLPIARGVSATNALKRPLILGFSILILHLLLISIDAWRLERERMAIQQSMREIFIAAFPQTVAIVDPPLQLSRQLARLKAEQGLSQDAARELLALAANVTRDVAANIVSLDLKDDAKDASDNATRLQVTLQLTPLTPEVEKSLRLLLATVKNPYQASMTTTANLTTVIIRRNTPA